MIHVGILGGGPAGAAAAITLRNAGFPVTIIERKAFPRYRPGETLHPGIEPLLEKLGVPENLLAKGYLRHDGIWSKWGQPMHFVPYGQDINGPWLGFQAGRGDFDQCMLESAYIRGAQKIEAAVIGVSLGTFNAVKRIETTLGPVNVDSVIDCTGGSHTLARQLMIPIVRHSPRLVARFGYVRGRFDGPTPSIAADATGWTWIAEVERERFHWTRVTEPSNRPHISWRPECLRGLVTDASYGADVTWRMAEKVAGMGWFLAGDAAAVLDPSSSHGVLRAVMTGMMAGHLIIRRCSQQASEQACALSYQQWLSSWFHHDVAEMGKGVSIGKFVWL